MLPLLSTLSPNAAILIFTLGVALIAVELNRPGWILPGALGLLLALLASASLYSRHPSAEAALEIIGCVVLMLFYDRIRLHWLVAALATIPLILAIGHLVPPTPGPGIGPGIGPLISATCGLILGAGTIVLTAIARRARQNKGLD
jgi:membrane-bound ClpP family serine protease